MGYKYKPNKSVAKRFRATGTGKLKRQHTLQSHLRSARDAKKKRHLGRPAIVSESHAGNMREMMGISGKRPGKIRHTRAMRAAAQSKAALAANAAAAAAKGAPAAA